MASLLSAELSATCNALGYFDPKANKYYVDTHTLETVKDLIRYLRRDDDTHEIRRHLGETQVLQTDLLPLLKSYWEETELFDVLLRLLVNLTSPALILWREEVPTEKTERNHYLQIEDHLQKYKEAFADQAVWAVLVTRLSKILELDFAERGDENSLIIERILILIRNVLYVPANPDAEKRPDNDASVHDQVLWALHQSGMLDIILFISSSSQEQAYYMHVLEILSFLLREQSAAELASAAVQRSQTEKLRDETELLAVRHREANQKQQKMKMYSGARHSRFGGTFVVKSMKSISDNELIYHKPVNRLEALNFDVDKKKPKTPKNRLPVQASSSERRSAFSIRLFLKEFCIEFLSGAYNTLMYHTKSSLIRARAQAHDESYYLWALRFFMEFNRCFNFEVKLVSETMSVQSFHFVQQQMEKYFDMMVTDKKYLGRWSRRLHIAVLAYRELLMTILAMDKCPDGTVRDSAKVIKSNIFYVVEYRELVITLLVTYDELKMSGLYLNDLLETQHIFFRMFQAYCEKYGDVVVQKKGKAKRKKKRAAAASEEPPQAGMNLHALWDEAAPQLSVVLEGTSHIPPDVVPFDAASEVPIEEQREAAMKRIQSLLREQEFENALGMLRAAREVWPENDCFGSSTMAPEEELLALREIFFADLGVPENAPRGTAQSQQQNDNEDDNEEENDEELEGWADMSEANIKFTDFTKRVCHPKVVRACGLALRNFERNSVHTNHCIVKLLHRIAFDCKTPGMIFQASVFRTFQKIYALKGLPQYEELVKFATYVLRQFFKVARDNLKVFVEALFWKSSKDAQDVEQGYGTYQQTSEAARRAWTELEEDELRRLFMEHQEKQIGEDVVDWVVNNLIDNTRSRRGVLKKLKEMYLLTDYKKKPAGASARPPRQWSEEEEAQLQELFERFRDAIDPLGCIMNNLDVPRPKNRIVEKLLVMGLIQDKKEVRKKRVRKSRGPRTQDADESGDDHISGDDDSSEDDTRGGTQNSHAQAPRPQKSKAPKRKNTKRAAAAPAASTGDLVKLLKKVSEMKEALEWLKESFEDVVEDLEGNPDDSDEGVPLVPILDPAVSAMENGDFLRLLKGFGVKEPADEQETHWRIPSRLTVSTLRRYCGLLTDALENKLPEDQETQQQLQNIADSSDEDVFDAVRRIINRSPSSSTPAEEPSSSSSSNLPKKSKHNKFRLILNDDSDGDNEENQLSPTEENNEEASNPLQEVYTETGSDLNISRILDDEGNSPAPSAPAKKSRIKRKANALDSDDEETSRIFDELKEDAPSHTNGKKTFLDSDNEDASSNKENVGDNTDSQSKEDEGIVPKSKKSRVIESDEED